MTQQINLYARKVEENRRPLLLTIAGLVAFALLLGGYWHVLRTQNQQLDARVKQFTTQLETEKAAVKVMRDALAQRTDPARIAAEIAALKSRAAEAQDLVERVRKGELGTLDGFSGHFLGLAKIGEPGIWLTGVKIHESGKNVSIEGRSLEAESVLRYANEVNRQVVPFGATVSNVEMTPVTSPTKMNAIAFKLN